MGPWLAKAPERKGGHTSRCREKYELNVLARLWTKAPSERAERTSGMSDHWQLPHNCRSMPLLLCSLKSPPRCHTCACQNAADTGFKVTVHQSSPQLLSFLEKVNTRDQEKATRKRQERVRQSRTQVERGWTHVRSRAPHFVSSTGFWTVLSRQPRASSVQQESAFRMVALGAFPCPWLPVDCNRARFML